MPEVSDTKVKVYTTDTKEEIRRLNRQGEPVTYYRIYAFSAKGTRFHIEVGEDDLANADKLLTARAKILDAI